MTLVDRINNNLSVEEVSEREDLLQHYQPTMQACYNLGFEVSTCDLNTNPYIHNYIDSCHDN